MNRLIKSMNVLLAIPCLAGCSSNQSVTVLVNNPTSLDREGEIVEIPVGDLKGLPLKENGQFVVLDAEGRQVPCQITHDSLLIFPVSVMPNAQAAYTVTAGTSEKVDTFACGKQYPERFDDLAWENDKAAYRAYGPALQAKGERSFGYDVFTKSVAEPVVEHRYAMETDTVIQNYVRTLRAQGETEKADSIFRAKSYHIDHGNGMDCYSVGATLGGGTAALLAGDSSIVYPYCYKEYEILDNGPLRFSVRLAYTPLVVGKDSNVVETRVITLDKGSHLNRTEIVYDNLSEETPVVSGIVIHPQNADGYSCDTGKRYIAYADSTDHVDRDNGVIYLGAVFTSSLKDTRVLWFSEAEKTQRPGALGHVLGISSYKPGTVYVYYWGSGWSKGGVASMASWEKYLEEYACKVEAPLQVIVEPNQ